MTTLADIEIGDVVRATRVVEGTVVNEDGAGVLLKRADGSVSWTQSDATYEIIEKRVPKVGDTIKGVDAYNSLPKGAVVRSGNSGYVMLRTEQGFASEYGTTYPELSSPRELVYLP